MTKRDDYLNRPILIHCCKDRTLTCRTRKEKVFNGRALAVFSVDTKDEAETLITLVGSKQYNDHPLMLGKPWRKVNVQREVDGVIEFVQYLELDDLDLVTEILQRAYDRMKQNERTRTDDSPRRSRGRVSRVKGRRDSA